MQQGGAIKVISLLGISFFSFFFFSESVRFDDLVLGAVSHELW